MIPNLISPLIDDRQVDVVYKNGHFLPSWGSVSCPHSFIHITLYCPLKRENKNKDRKKKDEEIN